MLPSPNPCTKACTWIWGLVRILARKAGRGRRRLARRGRIVVFAGRKAVGGQGRKPLRLRKKDASCRLWATRGVWFVKSGRSDSLPPVAARRFAPRRTDVGVFRCVFQEDSAKSASSVLRRSN